MLRPMTQQAFAHTALVTGASAGLGTEFARLFAADGHNVVLVARRKERLEQLKAELEKAHGISALVVAADLAQRRAVQQVFDAAGEVDFLVNNAGFGSNGPFVEQDTDSELNMIAVNVGALVHLTRLFVPQMIERGFGRILNIGSLAGFQPGPFMATYYASKAFVNHFSEALSCELDGTGVSVTVSCPGPVATEFGSIAGNDRSNLFKGGAASAGDIARHAYDAMMKGRRMAIPGLKNKLMVQSLRVSPRAVVNRIAARLNKPAS